jgi:ribosomal protein S18 acetylase RimI-like enzyme
MKRIVSAEQFREIRRRAVKDKKYRKTNLLAPDSILLNAAEAGKLLYEELPDSVLLGIDRERAMYLYVYTSDIKGVVLPEFRKNLVFSFYGLGGERGEWPVFAENNGMSRFATALRMSVKTSELHFGALPDLLVEEKAMPEYEKFRTMLDPYFEPLSNNIPDKFEYSLCLAGRRVFEAYNNGVFAGFCFTENLGKRNTVIFMATLPEFRGLGAATLMLSKAYGGGEYAELWTQENNAAARRLYESVGLRYDGNYSVFYTRNGDTDAVIPASI